MEKILNKTLCFWKEEHALYLVISVSVALFVLSFQPFSSQHIDFYNTLFLAIVIGCIVLLTMFLVRAVCFFLKGRNSQSKKVSSSVLEMSGFVIWLISSIICTFYLVYAESISISFYLVFKVALICFAPPAILMLSGKMDDLRRNNELLIIQGNIMRIKIERTQDDNSNKSIEFASINGSEKFSVLLRKVLFIKSADNYTEIHYLDGARHKRKLLRNTLQNIELQIKVQPQFIRCHRTCIVNICSVTKFDTNCSSHNLILKGYDKLLPVSRRHVSKIKKAL